MITALEFFQKGEFTTIPQLMIEFAQIHVEAALEEASEKAKTKKTYRGSDTSMVVKKVIDKESILNAYPLTNIK
jgi:hypothetical protein